MKAIVKEQKILHILTKVNMRREHLETVTQFWQIVLVVETRIKIEYNRCPVIQTTAKAEGIEREIIFWDTPECSSFHHHVRSSILCPFPKFGYIYIIYICLCVKVVYAICSKVV